MGKKRKHRSREMHFTCPKCGQRHRPGALPGEYKTLASNGKSCPKCGWEDRSETRRGVMPGEYSTGSHFNKLNKHERKRALKQMRKATDRLITAIVYAAETSVGLVKLANKLDEQGNHAAADEVDFLIGKLCGDMDSNVAN